MTNDTINVIFIVARHQIVSFQMAQFLAYQKVCSPLPTASMYRKVSTYTRYVRHDRNWCKQLVNKQFNPQSVLRWNAEAEYQSVYVI